MTKADFGLFFGFVLGAALSFVWLRWAFDATSATALLSVSIGMMAVLIGAVLGIAKRRRDAAAFGTATPRAARVARRRALAVAGGLVCAALLQGGGYVCRHRTLGLVAMAAGIGVSLASVWWFARDARERSGRTS